MPPERWERRQTEKINNGKKSLRAKEYLPACSGGWIWNKEDEDGVFVPCNVKSLAEEDKLGKKSPFFLT